MLRKEINRAIGEIRRKCTCIGRTERPLKNMQIKWGVEGWEGGPSDDGGRTLVRSVWPCRRTTEQPGYGEGTGCRSRWRRHGETLVKRITRHRRRKTNPEQLTKNDGCVPATPQSTTRWEQPSVHKDVPDSTCLFNVLKKTNTVIPISLNHNFDSRKPVISAPSLWKAKKNCKLQNCKFGFNF